MPIYEYECDGCQAVHELVQKMSDAPLETCPTCGGRVKKLISLSSFHLKGTGWYNTDYKKKSAPAAPSGASQTSETKSEVAPAVKAETPSPSATANPSKPKAS